MGLFKKMKDILFDEEEYTEQIKITPEMRNEATPDKVDITEIQEKIKKDVEEVKESVKEEVQELKEELPPVPEVNLEPTSERELFRSSANYPFFDFDEEEFVTAQPVKEIEEITEIPSRTNNVIEYEKTKRVERKTEHGIEITETIERRKFKPSPIISPVYGILDKDYNPDEIVHREEPVKFEEVREKAFGDTKEMPKVKVKKEQKVEQPVVEEVIETIEEKTQPIYEEEETVTITKPAEKKKKVKTIDELLEDTADVVVDVDRDIKQPEEIIENNEEITEITEHTPNVDDTLENDLFDLIDSMYDNKEEGE